MASVFTLHDVSGQVAWVDEEFLKHPVFGEHLIVVPEGTKPYLAAMYSGNPERLRAKLAKDLEEAEAAQAEDLKKADQALLDAAKLEENADGVKGVTDPESPADAKTESKDDK